MNKTSLKWAMHVQYPGNTPNVLMTVMNKVTDTIIKIQKSLHTEGQAMWHKQLTQRLHSDCQHNDIWYNDKVTFSSNIHFACCKSVIRLRSSAFSSVSDTDGISSSGD